MVGIYADKAITGTNADKIPDFVRMLKERGNAIYFEEEHINALSMDGEMMLTVLSSVAQEKVHNTSRRDSR